MYSRNGMFTDILVHFLAGRSYDVSIMSQHKAWNGIMSLNWTCGHANFKQVYQSHICIQIVIEV